MTDYEHRLKIISLHADRESGSPYWIDFFEKNNYTPEEVAENPLSMPKMDIEKLRSLPVTDFVSKAVIARKEFLVTGETSGFSGKPVMTLFTEDEFHRAFVLPFIEKASQVNFPLRGEWLWAGPSGPHIIGKAVRAILCELGGIDPFTVDFDPRWFRRLPPGSISAKRYMDHIIEQVMTLIHTQNIDIIFTTPPVLRKLSDRMTDEEHAKIKGVHYGGIAVDYEEYLLFQTLFPNAVHLNGYGNSLFGVFLEESFTEAGIEYNTASDRVDIDVINDSNETFSHVEIGEKGKILMSRYDESFMMINMLERDTAVKTERGILNPSPLNTTVKGKLIY